MECIIIKLNNLSSNLLNENDTACLSKIIDYYGRVAQNKFFALIDLQYNIRVTDKKTMDIFKINESVIDKNFLYDFNRSDKRFYFASYNLGSCIKNKKVIKFFTVNNNRKSGYETLSYEYLPLVNNETLNVVAVLITAEVPVVPISFYKITQGLRKKQLSTRVINKKNLNFSEREKEILFFLFHCNTKAEIAEILSNIYGKTITESSIRKLIHRNLYHKFNVVNEVELKNVIREYGFYLKVPDIISDEFIFNIAEL